MVARMDNRRCNSCGKFAVCYRAGGGWNCGTCASNRVVSGPLADALETLAEVAGDCPEAAASLARALRQETSNRFWGDMLCDMADRIDAGASMQALHETDCTIPESRVGQKAKIRSIPLKAQTVDITYDFSGLPATYEKGRERGTRRDGMCQKRYDARAAFCRERGYPQPVRREFKAPDAKRWAANYLRHERSNYQKVYQRLQRKARNLLGPVLSGDDICVICEQIHQTVKNRVQMHIARRFPELAEAAMEQTV